MRWLAFALVGIVGFRSAPDLTKLDPALRKLAETAPAAQEVRCIARLSPGAPSPAGTVSRVGDLVTLTITAGQILALTEDPGIVRLERSRKFRARNDLGHASTIAARGEITAAETDVYTLDGVAGQTARIRASAETATLDTQLAATDTVLMGDDAGPGPDAELTVLWLTTGPKLISVNATAGTGFYVLFITIDAAVSTSALASPEGPAFYAGTRAREARTAFGLDGSGIAIGIVDTGIDHTRTDFRDASGNTRLLTIWDQTLTPGAGESSPSQGYGVEYSEAQINADLAGGTAINTTDTDGHGTHVAGIAAGDDPAFPGAAPGARLLVIKTNFAETSIIDAISYFFAKAFELGYSAAVLNLSLGSHDGPHDGTGALDGAVDGSQGRGRYVVVAAGNEGDKRIHAQATVAAPVSWTYTPSSISIYLVNDPHTIDIWAHGGDQYSVTVTDTTDATVTLTTASGASGTFGPNITVDLEYLTIENRTDSPSNGATHIRVEIQDSSLDPYTITLTKTASGGSGLVDGYAASETGTFAIADVPVNGDGSIAGTVAEPGTAKSAITAGVYRGKFCWDNAVPGTTRNPGGSGAVAAFSSRGPTRDGRTKPDVLGPGAYMGSALSTDATTPNANDDVDGLHTYLEGTSMAAPAVAGILALLLQRNALLNVDEVKAILAATLLSDTLASGKIDALALIGSLPIQADVEADGSGCSGSMASAPMGWLALVALLGMAFLTRRKVLWVAVFVVATALPARAQHATLPPELRETSDEFTVEPFLRGYGGLWFSQGLDFEAVRLDGRRDIDVSVVTMAGFEGGVRLIHKWNVFATAEYGVAGDFSVLTFGGGVSYTHEIGEFVGKWPPAELTIYAGFLWGRAEVDKSDFGDFEDTTGWRIGIAITWRPWKPFAFSPYVEFRDLEFDYEESVIDGDETIGGSGVMAGLSVEWRF